MSSEKKETEKEDTLLNLQLGDVIRIEDGTNELLNGKTFIIDYISEDVIKIIDTENLNKTIKLKINENGIIEPGTITTIELLYRNDNLGYARQNDLLPGVWINIYFGGDVPFIITGEITNLEEDMIEIKQFPNNDYLYINFEYKGIPEELQIRDIEIRPPPEKEIAEEEGEQEQGEQEQGEQEQGEQEQAEEQFEKEIDMERDIEPEMPIGKIQQQQQKPLAIKDQQKEFIIRADEINFGSDLAAIKQMVDLDVSQQRFTIETQTNDLLNELLSKIPANQRTTPILNNIHIMIERYKQLRTIFSDFDDNGNVISAIVHGVNWKPLKQNLLGFDKPLYWVLPVAKNVKKIYDANITTQDTSSDFISLKLFEDSLQKINEIVMNYKSNRTSEEQNKYNIMINELNTYLTPFEDVNPESIKDYFNGIFVKNNITALIDNLGDFYSSVSLNDEITTKRFAVQKYNSELTKLTTTLMTGSKMITNRTPLTQPDNIEIKSILTLPEPAIRFSRVGLPGTNILDKSQMNIQMIHYWRIFKTKTIVENIYVDETTKDLNIDETNFANRIKNYVFNFNDDPNIQAMYDEYLDMIIPKTRVIFNLMKKYIKGKLSVIDVVSYLEPFLIYSEDLTYLVLNEINLFIKEEIINYNKGFIEKSKTFSLLRNFDAKLNNPANFKNIDMLISANSPTEKAMINDTYELNEKHKRFTNSEIMTEIMKLDFGNLLNYATSLKNIPLMLSANIYSLIEAQERKNEQEINTANQQNTCNTYVIAKQYKSIEELMEDNGKPIYFDKKYDTTNYGILEDNDKLVKKQNEMPIDDFRDFLTNEIQNKFKYGVEDAVYMAETLINRIKKVVDGNIAIVYVPVEDDKIYYYKRKNNRWEKDDSITNDIVANNQDLLCNFQSNCIEVDKKYNEKCESLELNKKEMNKKAIKELVVDFDKKYDFSKQELEQQIHTKFDYYYSIIDNLKKLKYYKKFKYNISNYKLGLYELNAVVLEDPTSKSEVVQSPYLQLLNLIISQSDFVKKQTDITRFALKFTREADITNSEEDINWRYCVDTHTKLLPSFIYSLAYCFIETPERYLKKLDEIKKSNGALSDDGDSWVDKHSGYVICKTDFDTDEGYEEGFHVSTREIMEKDAGDAILSESKKPLRFETKETKMISNIISALSEFMGINIEEEREFIIKTVNALILTTLPKESAYKKSIEEMAKKGKNIPTYKELYNSIILFLTLSAFLIGLQVSIPSVKTRKTFPGCVKSFEGYPIDGAGDTTALQYLTCVAYKIRNSTEPWSALLKKKESYIFDKIKEFVDNYFLKNNPDVERKIEEKRTYLLSNPVDNIPLELDLINWEHFLPPLQPFKIEKLMDISSQFKSALISDLKMATIEQREKILVVKSKIIFFSLAIQEKIQRIIDKKRMILTNSVNEPFLENACCNERTHDSVISYFEEADKEITEYNKIVENLSNTIYDINEINKSIMFYSNINTKNIYPAIGNEFNEETIYQAFIVLCKFHSAIPLQDDFIPICSVKPDYLSVSDSINEKIRKLKQDGRIYDNELMLRLLQVFNRRGIVNIILDTEQSSHIKGLLDIFEFIGNSFSKGQKQKGQEEHQETVIPKMLITKLQDNIDTFDIAVSEDTEEMRDLKNYLSTSNKDLKTQIIDFVNTYAINSRNEKKNFKLSIDSLTSWIELTAKKDIEKIISDDPLYNVINFIKSYINNFMNVFPNIILHSVNYQNIDVPKYLGLSLNHTNDIKKYVREYYEDLHKFYSDPILNNTLNHIQTKCTNLLKLSTDTPSFSNIYYKDTSTYSIFDRRTSLLLFENYFLLVIYEYIKLSDDEDMLNQTEIEDTTTRNTENELAGAQTREYVEDLEERVFGDERLKEYENNSTVKRGNIKDLKTKISGLLIAYLKIMETHKNIIFEFSYDKIMELVFKIKEKEKDTFRDRLEGLTDEERNVDTIFKINRLGVWNKGEQKGLLTYVKENYDEERDQMEELVSIERKLRKNVDVGDENIEQHMYEYLEGDESRRQIEKDAYDMSYMTEDYMDGDYEGLEEDDTNNYD